MLVLTPLSRPVSTCVGEFDLLVNFVDIISYFGRDGMNKMSPSLLSLVSIILVFVATAAT